MIFWKSKKTKKITQPVIRELTSDELSIVAGGFAASSFPGKLFGGLTYAQWLKAHPAY